MSMENKYQGDADTNGRGTKESYPDGSHDLPHLGQSPSFSKDTAHVTHEDLHLAGMTTSTSNQGIY
jgi:hypothetical protein